MLSHTICHTVKCFMSPCCLLYVNLSWTLVCQPKPLNWQWWWFCTHFGTLVENLRRSHDLVLIYLIEKNKYNFFLFDITCVCVIIRFESVGITMRGSQLSIGRWCWKTTVISTSPERDVFIWQSFGNNCLRNVFLWQSFGNHCLRDVFFGNVWEITAWKMFVFGNVLAIIALPLVILIVSPPGHQRTRFSPPPHLYSAHLTRWNFRCSPRCWTRWSFRCWTRCWSLWAALHGSSSDGSPPSLCSSQSAPPLKSRKVVFELLYAIEYEGRAPGSL